MHIDRTMLPPSRHLTNVLRGGFAALCLLAAGSNAWPPAARAEQEPPAVGALTAAANQRAVPEGMASRHEKLDGQLRDDGNGLTFPFRLVADGPLVRYEFKGPPPTSVQVRYDEDNSELVESGPDGSGKLTPANFDKKILGSDLAYEDLALRFVYWSRAVIEGDDRVRLRSAWKLRLTAPNRRTQYGTVVLWVDKESGAFLQAEGYDVQGKLIKRFDVPHVQKIEGKWYLKTMRIESLDPATGHTRSRTYLEISGLAK